MTPVRNLVAICATLGFLVLPRAEAATVLARDIAAQPLAAALRDFATQTGLQVVYVSEIAATQNSSRAARGLPAAEALERLLAGTGLRFEYLNERTVRILESSSCASPADCVGASFGAAALTDARPARAARASPLEIVLEEIVVTAQRREERLLDVPISLSVLPDIALERLQIDDVGALQHAVPNMTATPLPGTPLRTTITMRGQVEPDRFPTVDPAVGVYLDGVYVARMGGANFDLVDMERVEVLRGPQGTLYGRNTIGGAINLVPKRPDTAFVAELSAGAGNYDRRDLEAIINVPFAGKRYAVRVAASHTEHSGYGRNTLLDQDLNEDDTDFLRARLRLAPADRWDVNLSADYTRTLADIGLVTLLAASAAANLYPVFAGHPDDRLNNYVDPTGRSVEANRGETGESEIWGVSGVLEIEFALFALKALSAYRNLLTDDGVKDLDGTPYDLFAIAGRAEDQDQWNHELQAYGDAFGNRLAWIGGLHFFEEDATFFEDFRAIDPTVLLSLGVRPAGTARNESTSAFAQVVYALSTELRITGGVRYNEDRRQLTSTNSRTVDGLASCALAPELRDAPDVCSATLPERKFGYVPWTFGVDFEPAPNALLYAKVSRGHRAGGYNFRAVTGTDADTFEPEEVTALEIGTRAELFDRRLRLGLSVYRSLFEDMQIRTQVLLPNGVLSMALTQNAGEARIEGGELEVEALLGPLKLTGSLGITDGEYTRIDASALDVTLDSPLLYAPETTFSFAADLPMRTAFGELDLHADFSWREDQTFAYWRRTLARQDSYGLLNAMLIARFDDTDFELQLWAKNLSDERYIERSVDIGTVVNAVPGDPRTYGASVTYRFGSRD
jgi:iron complex outermembrane receptor protein